MKNKKQDKDVVQLLSKHDIPLDAVTLAFKQELFEGCVKKIQKRISAALKKTKANDDLKSVQKSKTLKAVQTIPPVNTKTFAAMATITTGTSKKEEFDNLMGRTPAGPQLDPHHIELEQVGKRVVVNKYDKHPVLKKRRDYREMLSFECTLDCIKKEHEKYFDPGM